MKKRGQKPDAYTYSILLRGYSARTPLSSSDVARARKIYESLYLPNSPVKPNIIHTNIMVEICARAGALDLLFEVGSRLSESGPNSPDQITYTSIFNALSNAQNSDKPDPHERRTKLVSQARRVWLDIIEKWKSGSLLLGEELVCSMGRVLLISPSLEDHDSVFTLLEDSMRIPRQTLGAFMESLHESGSQGTQEMAVISDSDSPKPKRKIRQRTITKYKINKYEKKSPLTAGLDFLIPGSKPSQAARPVSSEPSSKTSQAAGLIYSKPGNKTLSLLLATCAKLSRFKVASLYWDLLSSQFTPDTFNFIEYMRMLKISANASEATVVLREVYKLSRDRKSTVQFHPLMWEHGMAACYRTGSTKAALRDATRILIILQMSTAEPSFNVIKTFTKILSQTEAGFPIEDIMRAEESLMMVFGNFKSLYAFGRTETNGPPSASETLNKLISDIDPEWRLAPNPSYRLSLSRIDLLTEARSRLSMEERKGIRDLGRRIEITLGTIIKLYEDVMSHGQVARIRSDLYRVRAWVFPRNRQLLDDVMEDNAAKDRDEQAQETAKPTHSRGLKFVYRSSPHMGSVHVVPRAAT